MDVRILQLTIDCSRPNRLVEFWQSVLGYEVPAPPAPHATWRDYYLALGEDPDSIDGDGRDRLQPTGDRPGIHLWFQVVPERKASKNRLHLDLRVSGGPETVKSKRKSAIATVVDQVVQRGGHLVAWYDDETDDHLHATVADPEGNEFCLV
jgi:catechol 2,3-dioxygenase-like lactoylglutathione lyase family enzyme